MDTKELIRAILTKEVDIDKLVPDQVQQKTFNQPFNNQ
jgi:hypothetical protein